MIERNGVSQSGHERRFVTEHKKVGSAQLYQSNGAAFGVAKLNFENAGGQHLHNRTHLAARKPQLWPVVKQRNYVKKLRGCRLHGTSKASGSEIVAPAAVRIAECT